MNHIKSFVCTTGNGLVKEGYARSDAFKAAWALVKNHVAQIETRPTQKETTIEEKVREYKELQAQLDTLQEKASNAKEVIVKIMEDKGTTELIVDVFKVRYVMVVSNRFDTTGFKNVYSELYQQYLKESTCKRFTVA